MKYSCGYLRETLEEAGYQHSISCSCNGEHTLLNTATGKYEVWFNNKNHAGYGLIFKNTVLEFARSL